MGDFIPDPDFVPDAPKHGGPRPVTDDDAGVLSSPIKDSITKVGPVAGRPLPGLRFASRETQDRYEAMSPPEKDAFDKRMDEAARHFMGEVAGQVAGSAVVPVGEGIGAPIGRKIVAAIPKAKDVFKAAAPRTFEVAAKAIEHSQAEAGKLALGQAVARDVGSAAASGAKKAASTFAGPAAAQVGGAALGAPMSNAIDRLRASAAGNQRAAELVAKINQIRQMDVDFTAPPEPVGTVTQTTLGGEE